MASAFARVFDAVADWTLARVAPKQALRRRFQRALAEEPESARVLQAYINLARRGYAGAGKPRSGTAWLGGDRTADAELLADLPELRNRSRELMRDDALAKGLDHTFVSQCIGTGVRPQASTGDPEKDKRIEAVFAERRNALYPADRLDYFSAQRLRFRKHFEDGEVFRIASKRAPEEPLFFELAEADRCCTPMGYAPNQAGWTIRDGVVKDELGIPRVYWFRKRSLGDILDPVALKDIRAYFPVGADRVTHLRIVERPGQTRGAPRLHAVMQDLRDLDLLMVASLKRMQIAACLALFIKSSLELDEMFQTVQNGGGLKEGFLLDQTLEPGMMFRLADGEDISTLIPNFPVPELGGFIVSIARRIGAALGVSWQVVLKDFSDSTYSSARTDLLEARRTYRILQEWFIENDLQPEWRAVLADAQLRGDERLADCTPEDLAAVTWIPMGWQWIDPQKEAASTEIELRAKITTLQKVCAARGDDWREILEQSLQEEAEEARLRKEKGLAPKQAAQPSGKPKVDDETQQHIADLEARIDELEAARRVA